MFGATITGYGLAEDVKKGIIDRFRSLPMSPSAVLAGRTFSDVVNNVITLVVMSLTGLLVGWRIREGVLKALWAYLLLLIFAYAISWIMAWIGMLVPSPEVVNNASFMVIFPLTFVANTFVPLETLPAPLQTFAEWNPVSSVTAAARELFGNANPIGCPRADRVAAPAPRALHGDLVGRDPADLRPPGQRAVPQGDQPLTRATPPSSSGRSPGRPTSALPATAW